MFRSRFGCTGLAVYSQVFSTCAGQAVLVSVHEHIVSLWMTGL